MRRIEDSQRGQEKRPRLLQIQIDEDLSGLTSGLIEVTPDVAVDGDKR